MTKLCWQTLFRRIKSQTTFGMKLSRDNKIRKRKWSLGGTQNTVLSQTQQFLGWAIKCRVSGEITRPSKTKEIKF